MRLFLIAICALAAVVALARIGRELHAIHYQLALANCLAEAERGIVCEAAGDKVPRPKEGMTWI